MEMQTKWKITSDCNAVNVFRIMNIKWKTQKVLGQRRKARGRISVVFYYFPVTSSCYRHAN